MIALPKNFKRIDDNLIIYVDEAIGKGGLTITLDQWGKLINSQVIKDFVEDLR